MCNSRKGARTVAEWQLDEAVGKKEVRLHTDVWRVAVLYGKREEKRPIDVIREAVTEYMQRRLPNGNCN